VTTAAGVTVYGARLELCGVPVMIVIVAPGLIGDATACHFLVQMFHAQADETVVLMAQDERAVPTYYGRADIVAILARMPFEAIPWRCYRYRPRREITWRLPAPVAAQAFTGTDLPTETGSADVRGGEMWSEMRRVAPTVRG
jgi:hypothetical protein